MESGLPGTQIQVRAEMQTAGGDGSMGWSSMPVMTGDQKLGNKS